MERLSDGSPVISEADAQAALEPYIQGVAVCINQAWSKWKQLRDEHSSFGAVLSRRARASIVSDYMWEAIKARFYKVPGAHVSDSKGLRLLVIDDRLSLRFKKLDKRRRSRNVPTRQQLAFELQLPIEGIPKLVRLTAGYILNQIEAEIETLAVALPDGKSVAWSFDMPKLATEISVAPFTEPAVEPTRTRRVTTKKRGQDRERRASDE